MLVLVISRFCFSRQRRPSVLTANRSSILRRDSQASTQQQQHARPHMMFARTFSPHIQSLGPERLVCLPLVAQSHPATSLVPACCSFCMPCCFRARGMAAQVSTSLGRAVCGHEIRRPGSMPLPLAACKVMGRIKERMHEGHEQVTRSLPIVGKKERSVAWHILLSATLLFLSRRHRSRNLGTVSYLAEMYPCTNSATILHYLGA